MGARLAAACAVGMMLLVPAQSDATGCAGARAKATSANTPRLAAAAACLINKRRVGHGLRPLRVNRKLDTAAARHSSDMVARKYFDHIAPNGTTPVDRAIAAHYIKPGTAWYIAENIGIVQTHKGTAAEQVKDWMRSPDHRANILTRDGRDLGIGVAVGSPMGGTRGATYTLEVGRSG